MHLINAFEVPLHSNLCLPTALFSLVNYLLTSCPLSSMDHLGRKEKFRNTSANILDSLSVLISIVIKYLWQSGLLLIFRYVILTLKRQRDLFVSLFELSIRNV